MSKGILERIEEKLDLVIGSLSTSTTKPVAVAEVKEAVVEEAPVAVAEVSEEDKYAGVDAEGVVWDERIHSKAKEPKSVTTGKWKRKKGIADDLYDTVLAELKNVTTAVVEEEEVPVAPAIPTAPVPVAPTAPRIVPPITPITSEPNSDAYLNKSRCISEIASLESEFDVDPQDLIDIVKRFGGFDTIDKIPEDKIADVLTELNNWRLSLVGCQEFINEMKKIADNLGFTETLTTEVNNMFSDYDASKLTDVYPGDLEELSKRLEDYLISWRAAYDAK